MGPSSYWNPVPCVVRLSRMCNVICPYPRPGGGLAGGGGGLGAVSIKRRKEWFVKTGTIYIPLLSVQFQTTVAVGYRYDHRSQGTTHCDSELLLRHAPQRNTAQMALVTAIQVLMLVKHTARHHSLLPSHRIRHSVHRQSRERTGFPLLLTENNPLCSVNSHRLNNLVNLCQEVGLGTGVSLEPAAPSGTQGAANCSFIKKVNPTNFLSL